LTVIDEFTRHDLTIDVSLSMTAGDVIRSFNRLSRQHGRPACLRSDKGPGLAAGAGQSWLKE
jgi:transposase InsO family protein